MKKAIYLESYLKHYESLEDNRSGSLDDVIDMVDEDINNFSKAMEVFSKYDDRGAKRVVNWASKSTNIMKVVLNTYKEKGIDYIKNTKIWGFVIFVVLFIWEIILLKFVQFVRS